MRKEFSLSKSVLILSIAGIIVKLLSIFFIPILTAILQEEGYTIYQQSNEIFIFVYAIVFMGIQPAVAKAVSEQEALKNEDDVIRTLEISRIFYAIVGAILGILIMLLAFPIARLLGNEGMAYSIIALGPCILIISILATYRGYMQGINDIKSIALSQILEQILNVVISLLFAFILVQISLPLGSAGGKIGTSVGALFALVYLIYCYIQEEYEDENDIQYEEDVDKKTNDKKILRKIIRYSIPIVISAGLQNLGGVVDMATVMSRLISVGFTEGESSILYSSLGRYRDLYEIPLVIIIAICTILLPKISKLVVLNKKKEVKKKIAYSFKLAFSVSIPSAVVLSMISNYIYYSIYGDDNGVGIMTIGAFILILIAITLIQSVVLQGINSLNFLVITFSIGIVAKIISNYIFVGMENINIYGVLIGNCFLYVIPAILNHRQICYRLKMRLSLVQLAFKPIVASAVMAITLYICKLPLNFINRFIQLTRFTAIPITIILMIIGGFVYLYLMILLGGIKKSDIEEISPQIIWVMPRFMRMRLK